MTFTHLIAAGLALATLGIGTAAPAEAQRHDRGYSQDRGHDGRHRGYNRRADNGRHYGNYRQRCRTAWRHHRRIQICR